jgi:hypothetical protein
MVFQDTSLVMLQLNVCLCCCWCGYRSVGPATTPPVRPLLWDQWCLTPPSTQQVGDEGSYGGWQCQLHCCAVMVECREEDLPSSAQLCFSTLLAAGKLRYTQTP